MTDLESALAAMLAEHCYIRNEITTFCVCGRWNSRECLYEEHVAAAIAPLLGGAIRLAATDPNGRVVEAIAAELAGCGDTGFEWDGDIDGFGQPITEAMRESYRQRARDLLAAAV